MGLLRRFTTIPVVTGPPTRAGRLHAHYDLDAAILAFRSNEDTPQAFGFNVDGSVLFDCNEGGVLTSVMVNMRRELWQPTLTEKWRNDLPERDIIVDRSLRSHTVKGAVRCSCDSGRSRVVVHFGPTPWDSAVALSSGCAALLAGSTLVGLFVYEVRTLRTTTTIPSPSFVD